MLASYSEMCRDYFKLLEIDEQIVRGIKALKKQEASLYMLSGGNKLEIDACLRNNNLETCFKEILADEETKINHLKKKQASTGDLLIGDSTYDYYCAKTLQISLMRLNPAENSHATDKIEIMQQHTVLSPSQFLEFCVN